jgi:hypothetical protein
MNDDKLNKLLHESNAYNRQPDFVSVDEFKERFFDAVQKAEPVAKRSKILWLCGTFAAAAAILIIINVALSFIDVSREQRTARGNWDFEVLASRHIRSLAKQLKNVFPERNVNLWLFNDELQTSVASEPGKRDILVSYVLKRLDGNIRKPVQVMLVTSDNCNSELNSKQARGSVWAYRPDDKMVAVDTDLCLLLDDGTKVKIKQSNLLEIGKQKASEIFKYRGKQYQLIQMAHRI